MMMMAKAYPPFTPPPPWCQQLWDTLSSVVTLRGLSRS
jgi:hypothetical protein